MPCLPGASCRLVDEVFEFTFQLNKQALFSHSLPQVGFAVHAIDRYPSLSIALLRATVLPNWMGSKRPLSYTPRGHIGLRPG